jgi:hypothetical protein
VVVESSAAKKVDSQQSKNEFHHRTVHDAGLSGAIQGINQPSTKGKEGTPGMQRNCFWTYPFAPLPAVSGFDVCT